jgi:hypothetical protein
MMEIDSGPSEGRFPASAAAHSATRPMITPEAMGTSAATMPPGKSSETAPDLIARLDGIVRTDIADLFHGTGVVSNNVPGICSDIISTLKNLLEHPETLDLGSETSTVFLKSTLPSLVEVFVRRKTRP